MPRSTKGDAQKERRHNPLSEEYTPTVAPKEKTGKRKKSQVDGGEDGYVGSKASRKILKIGQDLADEDEASAVKFRRPEGLNSAFEFESRLGGEAESEEEGDRQYDDDDDGWHDEDQEEEVEEVEVDPEDLDMYNRFNPDFDPATLLQPQSDDKAEEEQGTNLADLILEKIAAHEANQDGARENAIGGGPPEDAIELPAKVVEVYSQVGMILSRYKAGKLPKPFKILPTLPQWDILLSITRPESWTPNACYEATKIFTSSRPALAQAFLNDILLPRVREDIYETKKLNVHLYKALKKALYKPAALFKGFLFPLLETGTCTLREAHIVSSVIARVSIPVLHSAAALYRLCDIAAEQMSGNAESGGATNIFIRIFLDKKYALPFKVVDALVFHFLRFRAVDPAAMNGGEHSMSGVTGPGAKGDKLPVLWHQCLLAFAQRYKNDITEDQREALLDLLLVKGHKGIGPEVRRELLEGRGRGVVVEKQDDGTGGDDTMQDV